MTAGTAISARQGLGVATARRRRLAPSIVVSILVHALLLALAILLARHRIEAPAWLPPPAFEVVPDTGGAAKPRVAAPQPRERSEAPPESAPAPPSAPAPTPAAPSTPPEAASVPPPAPAPAPAAPATPPPSMAPELSLPLPLLPEPALPRFEMPESRSRPTAPPVAPRPAFPAPMAFSLGNPTPRTSQQRHAGRGIDVSLGQGVVGAVDTRIFGRSDNKEVGPDWYNRFAAWWDRHGYYPPQAGANGQQGDVVLDLVVMRSGQVASVALASPSGYQWLDMAALGVFRGARLPSLPSDAAVSVPITLRIHYQILR